MEYSKKSASVKESSTLSISAKASMLKSKGIDIISFGVGEPDFNTPEHIKAAAIDAINDNFTRYTPSSGVVELRKAIAKKLFDDNHLSYDYSQIIVSNGAKHALYNTFVALLEEGDEVILPAPYWLSYDEMIKLCGGVPVIIHTTELSGLKVTAAQLEKALTPKTKIILINSPSNPSGVIYTKEELTAIAAFAVKNDLFVISDEIYEKLIFSETTEHTSIASLNNEIKDRTIVINGFSKSYCMTGWRVGYSASNTSIAKIIGNVQSHCASNTNSIAQMAAITALNGPQEPLANMRKEFKRRRDYIYGRVAKISKFRAIKPEGAFYVFIDVSSLCGVKINNKQIVNGNDIGEILLDEFHVAVVPGVDFGYDKHIRLSYSMSMDEIKEGMDRIEAFVVKYYGK